MRNALGDDATIMVANQAWSAEEAMKRILELREFRPHWVEEPIAADEPHEAWRTLAAKCGVPLAAGETFAVCGRLQMPSTAAISGSYSLMWESGAGSVVAWFLDQFQ